MRILRSLALKFYRYAFAILSNVTVMHDLPLQGVTGGYKRIQEIKRGPIWVQGVVRGYRGLLGVKRSYRGLQRVILCYNGLREVTRGYKGITRG